MNDAATATLEQLPEFFRNAPPITIRDPLAEFLGAAAGGIFRYTYADAVRLCGHSCPTVAGAYLITQAALRSLYGDDLPVRGEIAVSFREAQDVGTVGVTASVVGLITGAAGGGGFAGIGGRFSRRNLLRFEAEQPIDLRFTRLDTGVAVGYAREIRLPADPELRQLLAQALAPDADAATRAAFAERWQARVASLFTASHAPLAVN